MSDTYRYEAFTSADGLPMWSCLRIGSGIAGYGFTQKQALDDFREKEDEVLPLPRYERVPCGHFEPHDEGRRIPEYRDED